MLKETTLRVFLAAFTLSIMIPRPSQASFLILPKPKLSPTIKIPFCGDAVCNGIENSNNCPADCPSHCGNSVLDPGEECDDHNLINGDGCSSTCKQEPGYICAGNECQVACGNGVVNPGEDCDFGDLNGQNSGCTSNCQFEPEGVPCKTAYFYGYWDGVGRCVPNSEVHP